MTENVTITLIITFGTVLTGVLTLLGTFLARKMDTLTKKSDEIQILVNGNLHRVTAELAEANVKIADLHTLVAKMMETPDGPDKTKVLIEGVPVQALPVKE